MTKQEKYEILKEVREQMESTIISYKDRDPKSHKWGSPGYNGNCSGKVPLGFIDKLGAKSVCELYAGSGTLSDVCADFDIPYCGIDLNPSPVRKNIVSMDILDFQQELPDAFRTADMCFSHPPYPGINHIKYAGKAWDDPTGEFAAKDIQNMPFEKGMKMINQATLRTYAAMQAGSYMVILVGEIRANGSYKSMYQNLALPGEIFQTYIKLQHNTWSGRQVYTSHTNPRAMTGHEMIAVIKKPSGYELMYVMPKEYCLDIRDSSMANWKDIVMTYAREEKTFTNKQITEDLSKHDKAKATSNVYAKMRQTCAMLAATGLLKHVSDGHWALAQNAIAA